MRAQVPWIALSSLALIIIALSYPPGIAAGGPDWLQSAQQAAKSIQQSVQSNPQVQQAAQELSRVTQETYNRSVTETSNFYRDHAQPQVQQFQQSASQAVANTWQANSPAIQEAVRTWSTGEGQQLYQTTLRWGQEVGNRLATEMPRYTEAARSGILESYHRWGPEVGRSVQETYDHYGPEVGNQIQRFYTTYGPQVGAELSAAYGRWGPEVGNGIRATYDAYGPEIGTMVGNAYAKFDQTVGEQVRTQYVPKIAAAVTDERNRQRAIDTTGRVLEFYAHQDQYACQTLRTALRTPIVTAPGAPPTSIEAASRTLVHARFSYLEGTDIAEDPAKVITYCLIYPRSGYILGELDVLPGQGGRAVSCVDKLGEVSGQDLEATIQVLDLMDVMESAASGNLEPREVIQVAESINETANQLR